MKKIVNTVNNLEWNSAVQDWRNIGDSYPDHVADRRFAEMPESQREIAKIAPIR